MNKKFIIISIVAVVVVVCGYFVVSKIPPSFPPERPIPPITLKDTKPDAKLNPSDIVVDSKYVFEIGKLFTMSGIPLPNNSNFAPIYTENKILKDSIFQLRIRQFWSDACDRDPGMKDCPVRGEQMIRLEFHAPQGRDIYLTNKSKKSSYIYKETGMTGFEVNSPQRVYDKYIVELISIDILKKEATIIIKKVGSLQLPDGTPFLLE